MEEDKHEMRVHHMWRYRLENLYARGDWLGGEKEINMTLVLLACVHHDHNLDNDIIWKIQINLPKKKLKMIYGLFLFFWPIKYSRGRIINQAETWEREREGPT